jgi:3'(2'), 5'-bisphosphate nucleotidase
VTVGSVSVEEIAALVRQAGKAVMEVYACAFHVESKGDGSPVTEADRRAEEIILRGLDRIAPRVPVLSEEAASSDDHLPTAGLDGNVDGSRLFWLVDPLDGTKEFVSRNGEFTINVALVQEGVPVLGVVLAPAVDRLFAADSSSGAVMEDVDGRRPVSARAQPAEGATVVSSRSHGDADALARFTARRRIAAHLNAGSSLKFCLLAAGQADLYPRFGRTMEWDTAAGDAVLRAAGGRVTDLEGQDLRYGKPGFENPHFVAWGRESAGTPVVGPMLSGRE